MWQAGKYRATLRTAFLQLARSNPASTTKPLSECTGADVKLNVGFARRAITEKLTEAL